MPSTVPAAARCLNGRPDHAPVCDPSPSSSALARLRGQEDPAGDALLAVVGQMVAENPSVTT